MDMHYWKERKVTDIFDMSGCQAAAEGLRNAASQISSAIGSYNSAIAILSAETSQVSKSSIDTLTGIVSNLGIKKGQLEPLATDALDKAN